MSAISSHSLSLIPQISDAARPSARDNRESSGLAAEASHYSVSLQQWCWDSTLKEENGRQWISKAAVCSFSSLSKCHAAYHSPGNGLYHEPFHLSEVWLRLFSCVNEMLFQTQNLLQVPPMKKHTADKFKGLQIVQLLLGEMGSCSYVWW